MVSTMSPRQAEDSDDLYVVDSPSLHERLSESRYSDRTALAARPSAGRRASRALLRYLVACGIGVAGTLAWQAYGDAAKQTAATWGEQHGVPMGWLSYAEPATAASPPAQAALSAQATPESTPASSADVQQLKTMTLGLGSTLGAVKERIEQLATAQQQTANDVAKLQAAEQEIRQKISSISARPAAPAAPPKQQTTPAPRALPPH
jgi:hypothetical protein